MQERAYALLKAMIGDGRVRPGETLLEAQVARAFGVSRSPARHALHALAADKLLRPRAGRGFVVAGRASPTDGGPAVLEQSPLDPAPRGERVYAQVERDLCTAVLAHSVRITEDRLAASFGVSRTVARDVLSRMHSQGLIGKRRDGGWIAPRITPARVRDLYEMRWLLEPEALAHSAPLIPRQRLLQAGANLQAALADIEHADSALLAGLETELHIELLARCPNPVLMRALGHTHLLLSSNQSMFDLTLGVERTVARNALREHLGVVECLLAEDRIGASERLAAHLKASCGIWLRRFETVSSMALLEPPPYLSPIPDPPHD